MKVCPKCRMVNVDEALECPGCGADVSKAAVVPGGPNVSMFGSSPRQSGAQPLPQTRAQASAASSYGAVKPDVRQGSSQGEAGGKPAPKGVSFGTKKGQPKKPWER